MSPTLQPGTYVIVNKKSGTAFDLSGQDQRSIIGFEKHGRDNQQWTIREHGRSWTIQNAYNKKFLDVDVPNTFNNGERVVAVENDDKNARRWDIRYDDQFDGWRIFIDNTNINVDLSDHGNPANLTPVTLWGKWEGKNQVWNFEEPSS